MQKRKTSRLRKFWDKTYGKGIIILGFIGGLATLFGNLDTIENFFARKTGRKSDVKVVDAQFKDSSVKISPDSTAIAPIKKISSSESQKTREVQPPLKPSVVSFRNDTLDIKLRNNGDEVAFIKRAVLHVRKRWELYPVQDLDFSQVPSSATYDITLDGRKTPPFPISKNVSEELKVGGTDRFYLSIKYINPNDNTFIYLADLDIIYDEDDKTATIHNIFLGSELVPDKRKYPPLAKPQGDDYSKNLSAINEINATNGIKSPQVAEIIAKIPH